MAGSLIDNLLQTVAAPRTTEPARGAENRGGGEFRPVLDDALTAGPKSTGQAATRSPGGGVDESSTVAPADAVEAADDAAQERDCANCSLSSDSDHEAADAAEETGAVAVDEQAGDGDETNEEADETVEISQAAAEAAAALEASKSKGVTANATEGDDAVGDVLPAAESVAAAESENAGGEAAAKRAAEAGDALSKPADIQIGDVRTGSAKSVGDAAPDLSTLGEEAEEAKRKTSGPAGKAAVEVEEASDARPKIVATEEGEDIAQNMTPSLASGGGDGPTDDQVAREADNSSMATRDRHVESNSQATATSRNEILESAPSSPAPSVPSAPQSTTDAPPATAVATPAITTANENGSAHRSATAIARLSAERSLQASGGQGDGVDAARFISRVEGALRAAQQRDGRVQVRLSPPELGALRIELTIQNGVLSARLEAETPAARNLLLDNLPALRDRLAQQDVRIDRFDVDVRRDSGGSAGGNGGKNGPGDRPAQESEWRQNQQRQDRDGRAAAKQAAPTRRDAVASDAALDIRV